MPEEFTPEASVDFEALAAFAAQEAAATNGDGPHFAPPPDPPTPPPAQPRRPAPAAGPSIGLDPFAALEKIVGEQGLMFRELGDINAKLSILQLQTVLAFGSALLLAVLVWKFARPSP